MTILSDVPNEEASPDLAPLKSMTGSAFSILTQGKEVLFILVWVARSPRIAQVASAPLMNLAGCKQHSQMLSVAVTE